MRLSLASLIVAATLCGCIEVAPLPVAEPSVSHARAAAPAAAPTPSQTKPHVILNNRGGQVLSALAERERLRRWGGPVEVRGYCASACTIFITLPNACLGPGATVGFHAPSITGTDTIIPGTEGFLGAYYRNGILDKWQREWSRSTKITKISAREYVQLDPQTRLCE